MTGEVYRKLRVYEPKFNTAIRSNFVRFTTRELDAFNEVLVEHNGQGLSRSQRSCPHCLLTEIKKVAAEYFKYKDSPWGRKIEKELNGETETAQDGGGTAGE